MAFSFRMTTQRAIIGGGLLLVGGLYGRGKLQERAADQRIPTGNISLSRATIIAVISNECAVKGASWDSGQWQAAIRREVEIKDLTALKEATSRQIDEIVKRFVEKEKLAVKTPYSFFNETNQSDYRLACDLPLFSWTLNYPQAVDLKVSWEVLTNKYALPALDKNNKDKDKDYVAPEGTGAAKPVIASTLTPETAAEILGPGFVICSVDPVRGLPKDDWAVKLTGQPVNNFIKDGKLIGGVSATFGDGITVNELYLDDEGKLTANITILQNAEMGKRDIVLNYQKDPKAEKVEIGKLVEGFEVDKLTDRGVIFPPRPRNSGAVPDAPPPANTARPVAPPPTTPGVDCIADPSNPDCF